MHVEHVAVSTPLHEGAPNEDSFEVHEGEGGRTFFAAVVDAHGAEYDADGREMDKSALVAAFGQDVARGLRDHYVVVPDPRRFPEVFDAVALAVTAKYRPRSYAELGKGAPHMGAVAACVALFDGALHLAYAGDCRLYKALRLPEGFQRLSVDHNGEHPREIKRLRPHLWSGSFKLLPRARDGHPTLGQRRPDVLHRWNEEHQRFEGYVEPTRAFGDWEFHPAVTHVPETRVVQLKRDRAELFVLCSDGAHAAVERLLTRRTDDVQTADLSRFQQALLRLLAPQKDDATAVLLRVHP